MHAKAHSRDAGAEIEESVNVEHGVNSSLIPHSHINESSSGGANKARVRKKGDGHGRENK